MFPSIDNKIQEVKPVYSHNMQLLIRLTYQVNLKK